MNAVIRMGTIAMLATTICPAVAGDMPSRKPGLWQTVMDRPGRNMPPNEIKTCIDANTDAEMFKLGMASAQSICSHMESHRNGDVFTTSAVCKINETQMTSRSVSHFTGNSAYHTDITTKFDPSLRPTPGDRIRLGVAPDHVHVFDARTGNAIPSPAR